MSTLEEPLAEPARPVSPAIDALSELDIEEENTETSHHSNNNSVLSNPSDVKDNIDVDVKALSDLRQNMDTPIITNSIRTSTPMNHHSNKAQTNPLTTDGNQLNSDIHINANAADIVSPNQSAIMEVAPVSTATSDIVDSSMLSNSPISNAQTNSQTDSPATYNSVTQLSEEDANSDREDFMASHSSGTQTDDVTECDDLTLHERLQVPITGYEVMEERARFTVFKIQVRKSATESWLIFRRYTDFVRLNDKLRVMFPHFRLALPPKRWFGDNFDRNFLDDRLLGLQAFTNNIAGHKDVLSSKPVRHFFCLDEPPGPHDSLEESRALCECLEEQNYSLHKDVEDRDMRISLLEEELALQRKEIDNLKKALRYAKSDKRRGSFQSDLSINDTSALAEADQQRYSAADWSDVPVKLRSPQRERSYIDHRRSLGSMSLQSVCEEELPSDQLPSNEQNHIKQNRTKTRTKSPIIDLGKQTPLSNQESTSNNKRHIHRNQPSDGADKGAISESSSEDQLSNPSSDGRHSNDSSVIEDKPKHKSSVSEKSSSNSDTSTQAVIKEGSNVMPEKINRETKLSGSKEGIDNVNRCYQSGSSQVKVSPKLGTKNNQSETDRKSITSSVSGDSIQIIEPVP